MKEKFRYNKFSQTLLVILIVGNILFGSSLYIALIGETGLFFILHPYFLLIGLLISMILPVIITYQLWSNRDEEGTIEMHKDYAILTCGGESFRLIPGEFSVSFHSFGSFLYRPHLYNHYKIKTPFKTIYFISSIREKREKGRRDNLSLDQAMSKLMRFQNRNTKISVTFHDIPIILGESTPEIFDYSPLLCRLCRLC